MNLSKRQQFFQDRLLEILHHNTLDSYRVRIHNVHTILLELQNLLINWIKGNVKQFDTVKLCVEETLYKVNEDKIYIEDKNLKGYLCSILNKLSSGGANSLTICQKVIELIDEINTTIGEDIVYNKIFDNIRNLTLLEEDENEQIENLDYDLSQIDNLISVLCTELIFIGFTRQYLYHFVKHTFKRISNFEEEIDYLQTSLQPNNKKEYIIIFRLSIIKGRKNIQDLELPEFIKEFPEEFITEWVLRKRPNFFKKEENQRYFVTYVTAHDEHAAVKLGKEQFSRYLDSLHFSLNFYKIIPESQTLVLEKRDSEYFVLTTQTLPFIEGIYADDECNDLSDFRTKLISLDESSNSSRDVVNRLTSALRHLRIGDTDPELEQRFINYWIALEFLFSSPDKNENTFGRIRQNLINVLLSSYGYRNLSNLKKEINLLSSEDEIEDIWSPNNRERLKEAIEPSILLSYRLRKFEKHLLSNNKSEINKYLKAHEHNLNWQIARIYRLRNELIHEAAIKQNIENLTSNLRYYLSFILKKAINFFSSPTSISSEPPKEMESFFLKYDFLKDLVEKESNIDVILKYGNY